MEFNQLVELIQNNFNEITKNVDKLFEVEVDKDEMWNFYLDSFPYGTNKIFRERREYDCSCCRHFIKTIGNAVVLNNGEIKTIWDVQTNDSTFQPVMDAMSKYIKDKSITNVYITNERKIGTKSNIELATDGNIVIWDHFYLELPKKLVSISRDTVDAIKGDYRSTKDVFLRSLSEITKDSIEVVLELIAQNSLYKGSEWETVLKKFLDLKVLFDCLLDDYSKNNFVWENLTKISPSVSRVRNTSMGTLLVNISEGMELETAVKKYETIVAPANYKRPKAVFTQKMLEDAKKTLEELGYLESLNRRFATLDDITVNNILFSNKDSASRIKNTDVFDELGKDVCVNPKKFNKVEEVTIESFINNVLPTTTEIELLLENRHIKNLVSLVAPQSKESSSMFKWDNGFSWAYTGNITDSSMKENVKSAGGKVDGDLRFSIQWNDDELNENDYDAHCVEPDGSRIYFGKKRSYKTGGQLDVDIRYPCHGIPAVENITWNSRNTMIDGTYKFFVNNYSYRGGKSGFKAEIEFDGEVYEFEYTKPLRQGQNVDVAEVTLKNGVFTIKNLLEGNSIVTSKEVWNLNTNQFIPVSVVMYSPNYWNKQSGIGNKHYFFMLKDCINREQPNSFYNEFLKQELSKHKRVLEALGSKLSVVDADDQLSGLGFSSTKHSELIVKVKGKTERILKVKF